MMEVQTQPSQLMNIAQVSEESSDYKVTKTKRATVKFGSQIEVDAYLMPDGQIRFGKIGAALSIGYARNYLTELEAKSPVQFKALQQAGFTGLEKSVDLETISGGGRNAQTISLSDYRKLIIFAAKKGKQQAEALLEAILEVSLEDFARESFGIAQLTTAEKSARIDEIVSHYLEHQAEIDDRRLPGDSLYFPEGIN